MLKVKKIINRKDTWIVFIAWVLFSIGALGNLRLDGKNISLCHVIFATLESTIYCTSTLFIIKIIKLKGSKSYNKHYYFFIKLCSALFSAVYILGFHFLFRGLLQNDIENRTPFEYLVIFTQIYMLFFLDYTQRWLTGKSK